MKNFITPILCAAALIITVISCQDDSVTENIPNALGPTSQLTGILSSLTTPNVTINAIDSIACFNIQLPVEVTANGEQISVTTENDYATVEGIFNDNSEDTDALGYVFPITIVYPDNSQAIVSSQQQFNTIVNACNFNPSVISSSCVAINYPITVYGYNSSYQIQDTYTFNSNAELYTMLFNLGANEYYAINYPVTITVGEQETVTVTTNTDFLQAVQTAAANCQATAGPVGCQNPGVLLEDLIIYMPFSNNVTDLKGGVVTAPVDTTFVADRYNNAHCAISFNGSQHLELAATAANKLAAGDELSISLWFKMQNTVMDDLEHMFTKGSGGADGFDVSVYDGNTPLFVIAATPISLSNIWDMNWNQDQDLWQDTTNWHHLVITLNNNYEAKLYRDGVLQNSEAFTNATLGSDALNYFIGQDFTGFLDDLRVYRKVLSPADVQTLFELEGDCNTCLE